MVKDHQHQSCCCCSISLLRPARKTCRCSYSSLCNAKGIKKKVRRRERPQPASDSTVALSSLSAKTFATLSQHFCNTLPIISQQLATQKKMRFFILSLSGNLLRSTFATLWQHFSQQFRQQVIFILLFFLQRKLYLR